MPAKKIVSKVKKFPKVRSKSVNKVRKSSSKSTLPKVKLKSTQPVLVRKSIMYVFVSSLVLLLIINIFPKVVASLFSQQSNENNAVVLGDENEPEKSGKSGEASKFDENKDEERDANDQETSNEAEEKARELAKKQLENSRKNSFDKSKSVTVTVSPQGIKTVTQTEIEGGKTKTETKTYDTNGENIGESKIENQENETDLKAKTKGTTGVESSYEFKDKNGSVVMLKIREGDNSWSKLLYNEKNGMLLVRQKGSLTTSPSLTPNPTLTPTLGVTPEVTIGEQPTPIPTVEEEPTSETLAIKINTGGSFDLIKGGITANTNLPVEVDGEEGKVYVNNTLLNVNPDQVVSEAKTSEGLDTIDTITVTKENGVTTYMVKGVDKAKFLGLFDVTLPKTLYYTVDTNTLISESKTTMQTLLDAFSF